MVDLPFSTQKRLAVLDLRNRLERIAIQQFEASCDQGSLGYDNKIRNRLSFVLVTCRESRCGRAPWIGSPRSTCVRPHLRRFARQKQHGQRSGCHAK